MLDIRQAIQNDAKIVVPYIIETIGNIAEQMTGEKDTEAILDEFILLFQRQDNRHTYLNTYVAKYGHEIAGVIVCYSGKEGIALDDTLTRLLQSKNKNVQHIPPEAHEDEFYIDTLFVHPHFRKKGIGTALIQHALQLAFEKNFAKVALNVDIDKQNVIELYKKLSFKIIEPWEIYGSHFHHMVKRVALS